MSGLTEQANRFFTDEEMSDSRQRMVEAIAATKDRVKGQNRGIDLAAASLLTPKGHVLFNSRPGMGKTRLVIAFAQTLNRDYGRIQFTPDMMPNDILGYNDAAYDDEGRRSLKFIPGPINHELVHGDEINRAQSRVQSATLQAMEEGSFTTAEGVFNPLPEGFMFFATQNPLDDEGTTPLPRASYDRFRIQVDLEEVDADTAKNILKSMTQGAQKEAPLEAVLLDANESKYGQHELLTLREMVRQAVTISEDAYDYAASFEQHMRPYEQTNAPHSALQQVRDVFTDGGSGQRGSASALMMAQAQAFLKGQEIVRAKDVAEMVLPTYIHRMKPKRDNDTENATKAIHFVRDHTLEMS